MFVAMRNRQWRQRSENDVAEQLGAAKFPREPALEEFLDRRVPTLWSMFRLDARLNVGVQECHVLLEGIWNLPNEFGRVVNTANGLEEQLGRIGGADQTVVLIGKKSRCCEKVRSSGLRLGLHVRGQHCDQAAEKPIPCDIDLSVLDEFRELLRGLQPLGACRNQRTA